MRLKEIKLKKGRSFWIVYGTDDGWVVHTNKKKAWEDYKEVLSTDDDARIVEVKDFEELTKVNF
jgi:hypothetical protein